MHRKYFRAPRINASEREGEKGEKKDGKRSGLVK